MFVFMIHVVRSQNIPERLRKLAFSVNTIAYRQSKVEQVLFWFLMPVLHQATAKFPKAAYCKNVLSYHRQKYMDAKWKSCYDNSEKYPLFSGADKSSTI